MGVPFRSRHGMGKGRSPSLTMLSLIFDPTGISSKTVMVTARVMVAPAWTTIGKGSTDAWSIEIGRPSPSGKMSYVSHEAGGITNGKGLGRGT